MGQAERACVQGAKQAQANAFGLICRKARSYAVRSVVVGTARSIVSQHRSSIAAKFDASKSMNNLSDVKGKTIMRDRLLKLFRP